MLAIETIVTVNEDGMIAAQVPASVPRGQYRAVIVLDAAPVDRVPGSEDRPGFPDMAAFRESLGAVYPGNTVVEMREEERS